MSTTRRSPGSAPCMPIGPLRMCAPVEADIADIVGQVIVADLAVRPFAAFDPEFVAGVHLSRDRDVRMPSVVAGNILVEHRLRLVDTKCNLRHDAPPGNYPASLNGRPFILALSINAVVTSSGDRRSTGGMPGIGLALAKRFAAEGDVRLHLRPQAGRTRRGGEGDRRGRAAPVHGGRPGRPAVVPGGRLVQRRSPGRDAHLHPRRPRLWHRQARAAGGPLIDLLGDCHGSGVRLPDRPRAWLRPRAFLVLVKWRLIRAMYSFVSTQSHLNAVTR